MRPPQRRDKEEERTYNLQWSLLIEENERRQTEKQSEYGSQRSRKITKCTMSRKPREQGASGRQVDTTGSKSTERLQKIRTANDHWVRQYGGRP